MSRNCLLGGLEHFFPRPNGQFLVLVGIRTLARTFFAHFSPFWQCQETDEKNGPDFMDYMGNARMETTHFKKRLPYQTFLWSVISVIVEKLV